MPLGFVLRVVGIGLLALVLMIPVAMIRDLIGERQQRRDQTVSDIALGWGSRQTVAGPYVAVPYVRKWIEVVTEVVDGKPRERHTEHTQAGVVRLPVDAVTWSLKVETSEKARGIHKAHLYRTQVGATGRLSIPTHYGIVDTKSRYEWAKPRLVVGVSDPRGIRAVGALTLGRERIEFTPGTGDAALVQGVHALLDFSGAREATALDFSFTMDIAGSEALAIAPIAKDTTVAMSADWPHPSFFGPFLPSKHAIRADGFTAEWKVSQFAVQGADRLAGCPTGKPCSTLNEQVLGVSFIEPVGVYQQLDRASKYGFLFIGLLFASFYLFELMQRLQIHPIQYALVGMALALFFLLITALSEHIAFAWAYLAATIACVGLVTFYVVRVLRSAGRGLAFGAGLALLYGTLFMLLKAEDYALLAGSILLFALLAGLMIVTRRIDWYRFTREQVAAATPPLP